MNAKICPTCIFLFLVAVSCNDASIIEGFEDSDKPGKQAETTSCLPSFSVKNYWKLTFLNASGTAAVLQSPMIDAWKFQAIAGTSNYNIYHETAKTYLSCENGSVKMTTSKNTNSEWSLEAINTINKPGMVDVLVRIKHVSSGGYLNNERNFLECGSILPGWYSAMWLISANKGKVLFWTQQNFNCGEIKITAGGSQALLNASSATPPSCDMQNLSVLILPPCVYDFTATCSGKSWKGKVTVTSNGCSQYELK